MSRLDFVIFGATGFTGRKAVEETARVAKKTPVTWGVAGRSRGKLEALLKDISDRTGDDLSKIEIIIADTSDYESLKKMCSRAKVVMNCCGPYRMYGEPVVRACLEARAHQVDVSGEPQYIESMQLRYDEAARGAGVFLVSACGLDCVPNDMGVVYLQQHFGGTLNSVESYISLHTPKLYKMSPQVNYGTWESLVYSLANWTELKDLRKKLYADRMPPSKPRLPRRAALHARAGRWWLPFPGADGAVVYRTQRARAAAAGGAGAGRAAQFRPYVSAGGPLLAGAMLLAALLLYVLSLTAPTRRLLLAWPGLFSLGLVSRDGPSEEVMRSTKFTVTLYGEGWDESVKDVDAVAPNKKVTAKVSGVNPAYGATVTALVFAALAVLRQAERIPGTGGVLTTGTAFAQTDYIKNLHENNLTFEIVKSE